MLLSFTFLSKQNKARKQDSDSDNSGDEEMREIDLNKFMTVDSVGEIDDEMDADVEALLNDATEDTEEENEDRERILVGGEFVKEVSAFYCELCENFASTEKTTLEEFSKKHCLQRSHLKAYLRHKEEEKNAQKRKEAKEKKKSESEKKDGDVQEEGDEEKKPENETETADNDEDKPAEQQEDEEQENEVDEAQADEQQLWEDVDKDLGDLLRHVEPEERDEDEENDSVLNIDIER